MSKSQISIRHICLILKLALYKCHIIIIINITIYNLDALVTALHNARFGGTRKGQGKLRLVPDVASHTPHVVLCKRKAAVTSSIHPRKRKQCDFGWIQIYLYKFNELYSFICSDNHMVEMRYIRMMTVLKKMTMSAFGRDSQEVQQFLKERSALICQNRSGTDPMLAASGQYWSGSGTAAFLRIIARKDKSHV